MSIEAEDVVDVDPPAEVEATAPNFARWLYENFLRVRNRLSGGSNISGSFTTVDGKTITVEHGIITSIV